MYFKSKTPIKASKATAVTLTFNSSEEIISAIGRLYANKGNITSLKAFLLDDKYHIIINGKLTADIKKTANKITYSSIKSAKTEEYGKLIFTEKDLERLFKIFFKGF